MFLVVSCSPYPISRSRGLAKALALAIQSAGATVEWIDLSEHTNMAESSVDLQAQIGRSVGIALITPIHDGEVAVNVRDLIQRTSVAWRRKVVALGCVAGTPEHDPLQYSSVLAVANLLLMQYRCVIVPDMLFVPSDQISSDGLPIGQSVVAQIEQTARQLVRVTTALAQA